MAVSTRSKIGSITLALTAVLLLVGAVGRTSAQGKRPVIFIPGLLGSELINPGTGQKVWFKTRRVKTDDLRLPIGPDLPANRDALVPGDVLRNAKPLVFPRQDVYGGLLAFLKTSGGYREASWDSPPSTGDRDTLYVFAYDWRRDLVESSQILVEKIEKLKQKLGRPDLKFDIVAHSMGGLIARYAAMYGAADLPADNVKPVPTWVGTRFIDRIILIAPPNEGAVRSLKALVNGFNLVGIPIKVPFVRLQRLSKFDIFTIPTAFELLPAPGTLKAFDGDLKPISIDLYDPANWTKFGWNITEDKDFSKHFTPAEQQSARSYFLAVLDRSRRLHEALSAAETGPAPVKIDLIGADCIEAADSIIVYRDKSGAWKTMFSDESFTNSAGKKISASESNRVVCAPGDGVVTKRSLSATTLSQAVGTRSILSTSSTHFVCEAHDKLPGNSEVQALVLNILSNGK